MKCPSPDVGNPQPETTYERCSFDFRIPRRRDVDGIAPCAQIARLFDDVGKFSMFKINLSYFPTITTIIFKGFDLKSNMKGFFENFLSVSVKKLRKVLMILPSITDRGRAFLAKYCCYMPCLAISKFYRSWNFHAKEANPMINGQKVYHDDLYDENTKNNQARNQDFIWGVAN